MSKKAHDPRDVINAIWNANGYISRAADLLRASRRTIYDMAERDERVQQAIDDSRAARELKDTDEIEQTLVTKAKNGEAWAIKFYLSAKARDRGYGKDTTDPDIWNNVQVNVQVGNDQPDGMADGYDDTRVIDLDESDYALDDPGERLLAAPDSVDVDALHSALHSKLLDDLVQ